MNMRAALFGAGALVLLAAAGGAAWWTLGATAPEIEASEPDDMPLPIPPVPPRIAEGEQYESCLAMAPNDPAGALDFATAWAATGGGEGAAHCLALARIGLGNPGEGAQMLQNLAASSQGAAVARATIFEQAAEAWMIADQPEKALQAATLALALSPDDPDLLVDRATTAVGLQKFPLAIDDLTRALGVDATRSDALVLRGSAWRRLNRLDLAQDDIDRALALDPDNPEGLLERGILRQRHNDRAGARKDWERAISLAPDSSAADLAQQNIALLDVGPDRR